MSSASSIDTVLERLPEARRRASGWTARCPGHADRVPSLSISEGEDGRALLICRAGCPTEAIVGALGLELRDLFPRGDRATQDGGKPVSLTLAQLAQAKRLPEAFLRSLGCRDAPGPSVRIPYSDADGNEAAVRYRMALAGRRFRWRKGDHVLPYGLQRLAEARRVGWIVLVEGESDCWTAWHHGIPALGIPGKGTWRPAWASDLAGLTAYLWQEPDAADLVERVAPDLPDVRIIVAPPGTKGLSEAHIHGEDIAALLERLRAAARPIRELLRDHQDRETRAAHAAAEPVLAHSDPVELVGAEIRAQGYGGDVRIPLLGYLAMTSRVLAPRKGTLLAHTLLKGPSSSGKNAALEAGLRLLPREAYHVIEAGSARVLIYDPEPLRHRVVVFSEADSLPAGEDNPAASAIRNLLQDGHLHYQVTVRDPATGDFTVRTIDKPGPSVLVTTSIRSLGHQLMTRLFTVEVPDEPAQLRAALAAQARLELEDLPRTNEALISFQSYLQGLAPIDVIVPYARELSDSLARQPAAPRVLRDFPRLLSLVKAVAVLRIAHREHAARGRLVATIADYATVHGLVGEAFEASAGASGRVRLTVAAVATLTSTGPSAVTVSEVAAQLGISVPSAWRRVRDALAGGWLVNDESRPRQTARLRIGEPLPSTTLLPSPEELRELELARATAAAAGSRRHDGVVSTFSPDPKRNVPPAPAPAAPGERSDLPVNGENAKAPDPTPASGLEAEWVDVPLLAPASDEAQTTLWERA